MGDNTASNINARYLQREKGGRQEKETKRKMREGDGEKKREVDQEKDETETLRKQLRKSPR